MARRETYFSIDVESDGPIPGHNSMLSIGAVAFTDHPGSIISSFEMNLMPLAGAAPNDDTMAWWETQPDAWEHIMENRVTAGFAMTKFSRWIRDTTGDTIPVAVCAPSGYDFTFVYWYLTAFMRESPFRFSAIDVRSYFAGARGAPYSMTSKRYWPKRYFKGTPKHDHTPRADALGQGMAFMRMRANALGFMDDEWPQWSPEEIQAVLKGDV